MGFRLDLQSTDPRAKGRCMMFHEWNGGAMIGPLAEQFAATVTAFSTNVDGGIAESAPPDLLIFQISERFLHNAPSVA